jgi:hypothetical protein
MDKHDDQLPYPMNALQQKHPLAIRWFHWVNFPLLFLMIWSGLMIYWANDSIASAPGIRH